MNPTVPRAGPLLERNAELAAVEQRLTTAESGRGMVLIVEGAAGIGKTRLLDAARAAAAKRGFRVLAGRASSLEREFGFGVIRDLLTPVLRDPAGRAALQRGAARLAAPALDLGETAAPTFAILHGIFWLVAELAERRPLLLAVDDAHWADGPSLRALHHLAHRIADLPVLLAVATRPAEPGSEEGELLEALATEPATTALRLRPLSDAATGVLLQTVFGADVDERFAATCHEVSEGNPLLLSALSRSLVAAGVAPDASARDAVNDRAPAIVSTFVLPRLRHLPASASAVAQALAVLGAGTELRFLAAVARLDPAETGRAVDRLVAADLVVREPRLDFAHPLLAQAVADSVPAAERELAHRTAAAELAADGLPAESVAAHLLQVPPLRDPWVVDRLRDAARQALAKGAPQPAVAYLERALAEPPAPELRAELLFELGDAETHLGRTPGTQRLAEALALATGPGNRARVALRLARGLLAARELPRTLQVLSAAVVEVEGADVDPELRRLLEAEYIGVGVLRSQTRTDALGRLSRLLPEARADTLSGCMVLATASVELLQVPGRAGEAVERAEAALTGMARLDVPFHTGVLYMAAPVLAAAGETSRALAAAEAAVADAQERGSPVELAAALGSRGEMQRRLGALLDAEADIGLAHELSAQAGTPYHRRLTVGTLLPVLVAREDLDGAERELAALQVGIDYAGLLAAVGELRLAQGRADEALELLLTCGARLERRGWLHPGLVPWRTLAAVAHHRAGRSAESRELADAALSIARSYAVGEPTGVALRTVGVLTGDVDALTEAAEVLAGTQARLEHARALVELGAALRRANHRAEAREPLREGLDMAHRLGATALRRQATDELSATGARPRRIRRTGVEALSPSERRVARLAAEGHTNRDIAQALFVTTKTVEVHLSACYRKLEITSRAGLAGLLR